MAVKAKVYLSHTYKYEVGQRVEKGQYLGPEYDGPDRYEVYAPISGVIVEKWNGTPECAGYLIIEGEE